MKLLNRDARELIQLANGVVGPELSQRRLGLEVIAVLGVPLEPVGDGRVPEALCSFEVPAGLVPFVARVVVAPCRVEPL